MTLLGRSSAVRPPPPSVVPSVRLVPEGEPFLRQSNGLDQFFGAIRDRSALSILDFARASQANVSYITNMSHSISSQNFMYSLETTFGDDDFFANQSDSRLVGEFMQESLNFPPDRHDGGLIWDSLQFLTPQLLQLTVDRLYETLRPGSYLLAFFHANEKAREIPIYHY